MDKEIHERIESLERELANVDISLMQIRDRISDIEIHIKEKEEREQEIFNNFYNEIRAIQNTIR